MPECQKCQSLKGRGRAGKLSGKQASNQQSSKTCVHWGLLSCVSVGPFLWGAGGRSVTTGCIWVFQCGSTHAPPSMMMMTAAAAEGAVVSSRSCSSAVAAAASSQICALADSVLTHALRLCALAVFSPFPSSPISSPAWFTAAPPPPSFSSSSFASYLLVPPPPLCSTTCRSCWLLVLLLLRAAVCCWLLHHPDPTQHLWLGLGLEVPVGARIERRCRHP